MDSVVSKEYASKGAGTAGITLGTIGTTLGSISALGGSLGGLFGGGVNTQMVISEKDAKIAKLEAEKHSDKSIGELKENLLHDWLKPIADEVADSKVREAALKEQISSIKEISAKDKEIFEIKLELAKQEAKCCCEKVNARVDCLENTVKQIVVARIPQSALCTGSTTTTP